MNTNTNMSTNEQDAERLLQQRKMVLYKENRSVITRVFRELRKKKNGEFFARQNYYCCSSCAVSAIPDELDNWVFYHMQDRDDLIEDQCVSLGWQGDVSKIVELFTSEIGSSPLVDVKWDGSSSTRISLTFRSDNLE